MPLRKRKGRRRPEVAPSENQESVQSEENVEKKGDEEEGETVAVRDASMDEEEKRARETIALLAKKYQVKLADESSSSLDIIRVEDTTAVVEEPQQEEREEEGQDKEEKENKRTSKLLPKKRTKLQKQTERGSTPVFKVPRPLAHHSTPSGDRNLFGFEELDSPLTLSPVTTTPARGTSSLAVSEEGEIKPSPYSRLRGTYDIPFKKKTPRRPAARRRKSTSGEERWAARLNSQFSEVEQFDLAVE